MIRLARTCGRIYPRRGPSINNFRLRASFCSSSTAVEHADPLDDIVLQENGTIGTFDYKIEYRSEKNGALFSPWHGIPLVADKSVLHYINEIPRGTRAKFEIATKVDNNPIMQDTKNGALRFIRYVLPEEFSDAVPSHPEDPDDVGGTGSGMPFHYGALPQTWESPRRKHYGTLALQGDNDPLDVVNISAVHIPRGSVVRCRVIGAFSLIDAGEADWKVLVVCEGDPQHKHTKDIHDVDPRTIALIEHWFSQYKTAQGSTPNEFWKPSVGASEALHVVESCHGAWESLAAGSEVWATADEGLWIGGFNRAPGTTARPAGTFAESYVRRQVPVTTRSGRIRFVGPS